MDETTADTEEDHRISTMNCGEEDFNRLSYALQSAVWQKKKEDERATTISFQL